MLNLFGKSQTKLNFLSLVLVLTFSTMSANADIPNNCAQDSTKLAELVKSARFLPEQMDRHIVGHWVGRKLGARVDIRMEVNKSGRLLMDLHAVSRILVIDMRDKAPILLCFSNENVIDVHTKIFDKNEHVRLQVINSRTFKLLNGKLKATYKKQAN